MDGSVVVGSMGGVEEAASDREGEGALAGVHFFLGTGDSAPTDVVLGCIGSGPPESSSLQQHAPPLGGDPKLTGGVMKGSSIASWITTTCAGSADGARMGI